MTEGTDSTTPSSAALAARPAPLVAASTAPAAKTPGPAAPPSTPPDPEVAAPRRRTFTAECKRRVLAEVDACSEPGDIGALLCRHGLYSSHLTEWRRQREEGVLSGLAPKKRGRKPVAKNPLAEEVARLERENRKLLARAERAERLLELPKKVAELFGEPLPLSAERMSAPEGAPEEAPEPRRPRRGRRR
jgi:transposase-like protein